MIRAYIVGILMLFVCSALSGCLDSEPETEEEKWILVEEFEISELVTEYFTLDQGDYKVVYVKLVSEDYFKGQICYGGMCYAIDNKDYDGEQEFTIQSDNTESYLNSFNAGVWDIKIYWYG